MMDRDPTGEDGNSIPDFIGFSSSWVIFRPVGRQVIMMLT
jgi:hypothetical protein